MRVKMPDEAIQLVTAAAFVEIVPLLVSELLTFVFFLSSFADLYNILPRRIVSLKSWRLEKTVSRSIG